MSRNSGQKPTLALLQSIDPYEFEHIVAEIWEKQGYRTEVTDGSRDRGIDIVATKQEPTPEKQLVQVKRYSQDNRVGSQEIRRYATLYQQDSNADTVVIVTTSTFTDEAITLAGKLNVKPINGIKVRNMIAEHAPNVVDEYRSTKDGSENSESGRVETLATTQSETDTSLNHEKGTEVQKVSTHSPGSSNADEASSELKSSTKTSTAKSRKEDPIGGEITLEQLSSAGIWVIRLALFGFGVFSALSTIMFSLFSVFSFSLHPQVLPSVGLLLGSAILWAGLEQAYDSNGLKLVIVRVILFTFLCMSAVTTLEILGYVQVFNPPVTISLVASYYVIIGLTYIYDSKLQRKS